jgi:hypothetical protein
MKRFVILLCGLLALILLACAGSTLGEPDAQTRSRSLLPAATPVPSAVISAVGTAVLSSAPPAAAPSGGAQVAHAAHLLPDLPAPGARFGQAIAVHGDTAVVGAPQADSGKGAVYVLTLQDGSWRQTSRLEAGDRAAADGFGSAVALDGERLFVGASGHDGAGFNAGTVYAFHRQGDRWQPAGRLEPAEAGVSGFGWSLALDSHLLAVGAPRTYRGGEMANSGSVLVYDLQGAEPRQVANLRTGRGGAVLSDLFGWSLALEADTLVVGAYLADRVYVYRQEGQAWQEEAVLRGPDRSQFGFAVALQGFTLAVGAPFDSAAGRQLGSVSLYAPGGDGWHRVAHLTPGRGQPGTHMGASLALAGDLAAAGAPHLRGTGDQEEAGGVYVFQHRNGSWQEATVLQEAELSLKNLGAAVAIHQSLILAGAPGEGSDTGSVSAFLFPAQP